MSRLPDKPQQFSIATLLLVTTLIAVCLALFRIEPGLGALSLLFIVPAFLRTLSLAEREKQYGNRLSAGEKVAVYFGSLAVTLLVLVTMVAAFLAANTAALTIGYALAHWHEPTGAAAAFFGMIGAFGFTLFAAGWISRRTYPSRSDFLASLCRTSRPTREDDHK